MKKSNMNINGAHQGNVAGSQMNFDLDKDIDNMHVLRGISNPLSQSVPVLNNNVNPQ